MKNTDAILFDMDDTLIDTTTSFLEVVEHFVERLAPLLPMASKEEIRELQEQIDVRLVAERGFARGRFAESLIETWRTLAARYGVAEVPGLEAELLEIGHSVFAALPPLMPGARELLHELKGRVELVLYTLGVPEIQGPKILHHGFDRLFDEVHIVPTKTAEQLRRSINGRELSRVMVVGDSLRWEIAPALELGCRAVWVKRKKSWGYHQVEVTGCYSTVEELSELRGLLGLAA